MKELLIKIETEQKQLKLEAALLDKLIAATQENAIECPLNKESFLTQHLTFIITSKQIYKTINELHSKWSFVFHTIHNPSRYQKV